MDSLTHTLTGWALGQAGLKTRSRKGLAALILAANMADLDVFLQGVSWQSLATHRGFTHSLVGGTLVMPLILWGLLLLLDRWQVARGATFRSGLALRPGWLLGLCYIGALTHPLLDLQTTYAVQLFAPFSNDWYHSDSLFIIDVWLWSLLGLSIAWSRMREKQGRPWRGTVRYALLAMLAYVGFNLGLSDGARSALRHSETGATHIFTSPDPVLSWRRSLAWQVGDCYRWGSYRLFGEGFHASRRCRATGMDDPLVRKAIARDLRLRKFLGWSIMPMATIERGRCEARVMTGDARYWRPGSRRSPLWRESVVPIDGPGCPRIR